jgi:hypothetical protein
MTTTQPDKGTFQSGPVGTLRVLGWSGENPEDGKDLAFLLAFSTGDGADGPEAGEAAARALLKEIGLPLGGAEPESMSVRNMVSLLVEGDQVALTMPRLSVKYQAREEWLAAARQRGQVYFLFATRPWTEAATGAEVTEEALRAFVGDEEVLAGAAHLMLPVRTIQS